MHGEEWSAHVHLPCQLADILPSVGQDRDHAQPMRVCQGGERCYERVAADIIRLAHHLDLSCVNKSFHEVWIVVNGKRERSCGANRFAMPVWARFAVLPASLRPI